MARTDFPPVRACLFDMDGLLLDTEDIATRCHSLVLAMHDRPPLPPRVKAQMLGRTATNATQILQGWARLPISNEEYRKEVSKHQKMLFPYSSPLPGVATLLRNLDKTKEFDTSGNAEDGPKRVHIALATSSSQEAFTAKTKNLSDLFSVFEPHRRILGDDPRMSSSRGKPSPDIFQLALKAINDSLAEGEKPIAPEECLVFEDSAVGVEAGRRAGMRVIWCPLQMLAEEYAGMEAEVLAGRTGAAVDNEPHQVGEIGDGWAERVDSLENFDYEKYGITLPQAKANGTKGDENED